MPTSAESHELVITAFNCSPGMGSDHASGWNHIFEISKLTPITVITDSKYQNTFEGQANGRIKFIFISVKYDLTGFNTLSYPWGFYLTYRRWEKEVYKFLRTYIVGRQVIVHRLTLGALKEPGYCWGLGVPYIWSQLYFPQPVSYRFFGLFSSLTKLVMLYSNYAFALNWILKPRVRKAIRKSDILVANSHYCQRVLSEKTGRQDIDCLFEIGAPDPKDSPCARRREGEPLQLVWVGRMVDFKGLQLLLMALSSIPEVDYVLTIAGEGRDRERLLQQATDLGVKHRYLGMLDYRLIPDLFARSHAFVYSSFRDGVTNVVFEALSNNCPLVYLDHLPYSEIIHPDCGIGIPVGDLNQVVADIAAAIKTLYHNEAYRFELASSCQKSLKGLSWKDNAMHYVELYRRLGFGNG